MRFRGSLIRAESSGEKFLRSVLLLAVFAGVGALFWWNSERTLNIIQSKSMVWDRTETMTSSEKAALRELGRLFKEEYGLTLRVQATQDAFEYPELDSKTIFVGVVPSRAEVVVELPPLVRSALDAEFMADLRGPHFQEYFRSGDWPTGVIFAVTRLWEELQAAG